MTYPSAARTATPTLLFCIRRVGCCFKKAAYDPDKPLVSVLTIYSSKGLEFETVVLAGVDKIQFVTEELVDQARLMYVGNDPRQIETADYIQRGYGIHPTID